jgi:hypothetical protein
MRRVVFFIFFGVFAEYGVRFCIIIKLFNILHN